MSQFPQNTTHTIEATACTEEQKAVIKAWLAEKNIDATQVMAVEIRKTFFKDETTWSANARTYMTVNEAPNALNPHGYSRVLPGYRLQYGFWRPETELDHQLIGLVDI